MKKKVLIIRFSSIGDIIQCMSVINPLSYQLDAEVHWICRSDFSTMLSTHPELDKIWSYNKKTGLAGLFKMVALLRREKFDYVYDAHQNIRSLIVRILLGFPSLQSKMNFTIRKKHRFRRFLFFQLHIRKAIPVPFKAVVSFRKPLLKWGIDVEKTYDTDWHFSDDIRQQGNVLLGDVFDDEKVITIVPSAAWELKRWPVTYWQELVAKMSDYRFIILAGPDDVFTREIEEIAPDRVINLSGKTSLQVSFYVISKSRIVVSADTGFLHAADLFRRKAIALMGPTAFGYPTGKTVKVLEINNLKCRPCTKAGNTTCKMPEEYRACLLDIKPNIVINTILELQNNQ